MKKIIITLLVVVLNINCVFSQITGNIYAQEIIVLIQQFQAAAEIHDEDKMIECSERGAKLIEYLNGDYFVLRTLAYRMKASVFFYRNQYSEALEHFNNAELIFESYMPNDPNYANLLSLISICYSELGDYENATIKIQKAIDILNLEENDNYSKANKASCYVTLSDNYCNLQRYEDAIMCLKHAIDLRFEEIGRTDIFCLTYMKGIAENLQKQNKFSESNEMIESILKYNNEIDNYPNFIGICYNIIAENYYFMKDYPNARKSLEKALPLIIENYGYNSLNTAYIYQTSFILNTLDSQFIDAAKDAQKASSIYNELILNQLSTLTSQERFNYITKKLSLSQNIINYLCADPDNRELANVAYDNSLLYKNILLNSSVEIENIVTHSGDKSLMNFYFQLQKIRKNLTSLNLNTDQTERNELIAEAENIEKIITKNERVREFVDVFKINSTNITNALTNDDIAIEIVTCDDNYSQLHFALVLRNNWSVPKCIPIGTKDGLEEFINNKDALYNIQSYKYIWEEIIDSAHIQPNENIYISPDGIINKLPIEYIPTEDGTIMADKYNIHRVSSTRELCFREEEVKPSSAVLYGGLKYNVDDDTLLAQSAKYSNVELSDDYIDNMLRGERGDDLQRAKYNELPYTKIEVDAIEKTLKSKKINVKKFTQAEGNEKSFKAMSGKAPSIIHIATHGFYLQPTEAEINSQKTSIEKMTLFSDNKQNFIDYSMNRTGLLMAGAQNAITGKSIPEGVDDGILTAKEISLLDLHGVDLAVLSACQTGLGDMTTDGIAGLQRGFKNAGVKTILMSLWKVDDGATSMLMAQFYKELMNGKSKHDALRSAQKYLREYEQDGERIYADFKYWAAFVLLD